jgi:hypothetical protein
MMTPCQPATSGSGIHGHFFSVIGRLGDRTVLTVFSADKIFIGQAIWTILVLLISFGFIWIVVPMVASREWFVDAVEGAVGLVGVALLLPEDWIRTRLRQKGWIQTRRAVPDVLEKVTVAYGWGIAKLFDLLTVIIRSALPDARLFCPAWVRRQPAATGPRSKGAADFVIPTVCMVIVVLCFLYWNQARCVPGSPTCVHPLGAWFTVAQTAVRSSG